MISTQDKIKALAALAIEKGADMTKATTGGGGDYVPPAAGPTRLRLVAYIELGKQKDEFQGKPRNRDKCSLVFELSGPKHQPTAGDDGTKHPHRITITESLSLNEKANFFKLFQRLNYKGTAQHIAQLLGEAFKGTVVHRPYAKAGEPKADPTKWTGVAAELKNKQTGYTIEPPRYEVVDENGPTGEHKVLPVDPPISELKCFLWDHADMEQWASIFIDGKYDDRKDEKTGVITPGKSKNKWQDTIKTAVNFRGSPIHHLLTSGGKAIDIPDVSSIDADPEAEEDVTTTIGTKPPISTPNVLEGEAAADMLSSVV